MYFCLIFLLIDSDGETHQFPSKPLRESQSRLLSNGQTWTENDEAEEQDREGGIGGVFSFLLAELNLGTWGSAGTQRYYKKPQNE